MGRLVISVVVSLAALSMSGCAPLLGSSLPPGGETSAGKIVHVADGDTILVALDNGRVVDVRLLAIDSPEKYATRFGSPFECGSLAASEFMQRFEGRRVLLVADASQARRDRYGRLLRYADLPSGADLGGAEVSRGLAMPYRFATTPTRLSRYRALALRARSIGLGTWGSECRGDFHSSVPGIQDGL
jgi:micrococcal nuclease